MNFLALKRDRKGGRAGCGLGVSHLYPKQRRNEAGKARVGELHQYTVRKEREQWEKESREK